ncbi:MAG: glutaredoxin 3 [Magnetococcales bacterium]|nr:glutaredoxin 3 [Magnetococcales bacterium]MBF0414152.1 glutaredoxin 3 [Magnetococcales bacterium]MBF0421274.1 glutaredoxin 3 [Magnetococcales bacterium]
MLEVEIYSTTVCPYCVRAKQLLDKKKVAYREINLTQNPELRDEMLRRANGKRTVPQIFINGQHVGGCDDLYALESSGQLDPLLVHR